jgi:hypothetical protein
MRSGLISRSKSALAPCLAALLLSAAPAFAQVVQDNLVSDIPGLAAVTDPALVNPWGMASSTTSPWWVSDNGGCAGIFRRLQQ